MIILHTINKYTLSADLPIASLGDPRVVTYCKHLDTAVDETNEAPADSRVTIRNTQATLED
jgi:hypothetical protein